MKVSGKKNLNPIFLTFCFIFYFACSPTIRFTVLPTKTVATKKIKLFINSISDNRPYNEKIGYKIFYVESISDKDYENGFINEFRTGITRALKEKFILVSNKKDADLILDVTVEHFYGEYSRGVMTVFYEKASIILLYIPRLFTDFISYNTFAGRISFTLGFTLRREGGEIRKKIDERIVEEVSTYSRSSSTTASSLSSAANEKLEKLLSDVYEKWN